MLCLIYSAVKIYFVLIPTQIFRFLNFNFIVTPKVTSSNTIKLNLFMPVIPAVDHPPNSSRLIAVRDSQRYNHQHRTREQHGPKYRTPRHHTLNPLFIPETILIKIFQKGHFFVQNHLKLCKRAIPLATCIFFPTQSTDIQVFSIVIYPYH
jgi:hypothetical protein